MDSEGLRCRFIKGFHRDRVCLFIKRKGIVNCVLYRAVSPFTILVLDMDNLCNVLLYWGRILTKKIFVIIIPRITFTFA